MGRVEGKIALITGAARGQGRSHALRLAEEGADIIPVDLCAPVESAPYAMATEDDLATTVREVERRGRRAVSAQADVRDPGALEAAVKQGVEELGGLDIVSLNAGICSFGEVLELPKQTWQEMIEINLNGAFNTVQAAVPHIVERKRGGSVIFTASIAGLEAVGGIGHYNASKHGIIGLMRTLAIELAPEYIRVNAVCPGNVDTDMIQNEACMKLFMPELEHPTREDAERPDSIYREINAIPIPWLDSADVTNAVLFLASDESRYITGVALPVDAGRMLK